MATFEYTDTFEAPAAAVFAALTDLEVRPDDILVMRQGGPLGAPGMPEWGFLPLPKKLLQQGIRDMVRISDARMSGTAFGTVVVHATPESAAGGPLAAVRTGDLIELDLANRRLDLLVPQIELSQRLGAPPPPRALRGWRRPMPVPPRPSTSTSSPRLTISCRC